MNELMNSRKLKVADLKSVSEAGVYRLVAKGKLK